MSSEIGFGVMVNMGGAIVHDQMNASRVPIAASHLPHAPQKVLVVVLVQTPALHRAIVDVERHLKGDRPMPVILKLVSLNLAWLHGLPGHGPRQGLDVRVRPGSLGEIMQFSQHQPNGGVGNANRSYRPYA